MSCVHILSPPLECNFCEGRDCGQICSLLDSYHLLKQRPAQVGERMWNVSGWKWSYSGWRSRLGGWAQSCLVSRPSSGLRTAPPTLWLCAPSRNYYTSMQRCSLPLHCANVPWVAHFISRWHRGHHKEHLQYLYPHVHSSITYKNQKLEATQLSINGWTSRRWPIRTVEYYSAFKRGNPDYATMWINLEDIMLPEINQSQKDKNCTFLLTWGSRVVKFTEMKSRMVVASGWEESRVSV